jgi:hypothetical protein
LLTALATSAAALLTAAVPASANPNSINPIPVLNGSAGLPQLPPGPTQAVFQATGMASPNGTQSYNVLGTDLGIMWDDGHGQMLSAFGDTAGLGLPNLLVGSLWAWRSNILLRSHTTVSPANGIFYDSEVRDGLGQAKDLIPSPKIPFVEISRIPSAGISVNGTQFMSLMSVNHWETDGHWATNYSSLAASGDDGQTWGELPGTRRGNGGRDRDFQMNAFLKDGGYIYEYGTASGRDNPGFIARVPQGRIADLGAYEYWDGRAWRRGVNAARPIVGGVAELSVMWNQYLGRFVMLTTDPWNSVVMRTAPAPQGPWSPPRVLIQAAALPTQYAPMIYPYQTGRYLYFLTTIHSQYNVVLMRTTL